MAQTSSKFDSRNKTSTPETILILLDRGETSEEARHKFFSIEKFLLRISLLLEKKLLKNLDTDLFSIEKFLLRILLLLDREVSF